MKFFIEKSSTFVTSSYRKFHIARPCGQADFMHTFLF